MLTNSVRTPCKARDFCLVRNSQWRYSNVVVGGKIRENCFLGTLTKTILNSIIVVFSLLIHEVLLQFAELWGQQKRRQKGTFWKMLIFHKKKLGKRCSFDPPCYREHGKLSTQQLQLGHETQSCEMGHICGAPFFGDECLSALSFPLIQCIFLHDYCKDFCFRAKWMSKQNVRRFVES